VSGQPALGRRFIIAPVSGLVLVHNHDHVVPLTEAEQISPSAIIDARQGTRKLTTATATASPGSATDAAAKHKRHRSKAQSGDFGGAVFRVHQAAGGPNKGLATVMMVESAFKGAPSQAICKRRGGAADAQAAAVSSKVIQLLHAHAHGRFGTSGRYSSATVRGTVWTMTARCDGTLTRDVTDSVVVKDFVRHRTVVLHPGQSYLAPGPVRMPHRHK
jgi:hypothetical protein